MLSFKSYLLEGVNDPAIFKAIFLAGGPGSGKSFIVGKTGLQSMGFKLINSDNAFERALKKTNLAPTPDNISSPEGQQLRNKSKELTSKQMQLALDGRLGLVIDGTGKDFEKIQGQVNELRKLGYAVMMIFVNTDLETAKSRNKQRPRSLPDDMVTKLWNAVQKNIGKFQNLFNDRLVVIDNSDGANYEGAVLNAYRKAQKWSKEAPTNPIARKWIAQVRKNNG